MCLTQFKILKSKKNVSISQDIPLHISQKLGKMNCVIFKVKLLNLLMCLAQFKIHNSKKKGPIPQNIPLHILQKFGKMNSIPKLTHNTYY